MHELALLGVPLAALASLTIVGAGVTTALSPRFPRDAQAALAPVVGAALVATASVLVPLGVPARPLAVGVGVLGAAVTVACARRALAVLRSGAVPLAIAVCAVALAGAPSLARGDWGATSLYGSTDSYHWSSQARSYLDGPAPPPISEHPDRLSYERSKTQSWAFALPFGTLVLAWASGERPVRRSTRRSRPWSSRCCRSSRFACARACFEWRGRWAFAAALFLLADAALLYASHFSWQQQLAGTAFVFAAVTVLRLSLEPGAARREARARGPACRRRDRELPAGFRAVLRGGDRRRRARLRVVEPRRARSDRPPLMAFVGRARRARRALAGRDRRSDSATTWPPAASPPRTRRRSRAARSPRRSASMPRLWALEAGVAVGRQRSPGSSPASLLAAALLGAGAIAARRQQDPAGRLPGGRRWSHARRLRAVPPADLHAVPHLQGARVRGSVPRLARAEPARLRPRQARRRGRRGGCRAGGRLGLRGDDRRRADDLRTTERLEALSDAGLPAGAVVSIRLEDPWEQAWALYYLREHRLSVERPSFILTGEGRPRDPAQYRHRPFDYVSMRDPERNRRRAAGTRFLIRRSGVHPRGATPRLARLLSTSRKVRSTFREKRWGRSPDRPTFCLVAPLDQPVATCGFS